jgi:hypothetical protein
MMFRVSEFLHSLNPSDPAGSSTCCSRGGERFSCSTGVSETTGVPRRRRASRSCCTIKTASGPLSRAGDLQVRLRHPSRRLDLLIGRWRKEWRTRPLIGSTEPIEVGLENRCASSRRTEGSNPSPSASCVESACGVAGASRQAVPRSAQGSSASSAEAEAKAKAK